MRETKGKTVTEYYNAVLSTMRIKYVHASRAFQRYFWKAVEFTPLIVNEFPISDARLHMLYLM